ncbi:hypothetical protein [Psychroflexus aestuariivivens]|uniref:hypothetical protein n=1 Tax=Psychroflexus aestuariivivens TaxID=1795040 RepID=UPI000FD8A2AD|nr:hypothetical protein [Psychroflexus aestuariivivens]
METKNTTTKAIDTKEINLVDGEFTKSQAMDIVSALIDQKINYHRIEGMQFWESNHQIDKKPINNRVEQLKAEKEKFQDMIRSLSSNQTKLKIDGVLKIEIIE